MNPLAESRIRAGFDARLRELARGGDLDDAEQIADDARRLGAVVSATLATFLEDVATAASALARPYAEREV